MTINADASSSLMAAMNANAGKALTSSASSVSTSTELSEEEKNYDVDNDGVLSTTEKAAMLEAQAAKKAAESGKTSVSDSEDVSVNISQEAQELQKQSQQMKAEQTNENTENEAEINQMKEMLEQYQSNDQRLMKEAISEYKKFMPDAG